MAWNPFRPKLDPVIVEDVRGHPLDIPAWVRLIDHMNKQGRFTPDVARLVRSHELFETGHAVHAFAGDIAKNAGPVLQRLAADPVEGAPAAVEQLCKWTATLQCGYSHDVTKGYFIDAEPHMALQWEQIIWPMIADLDFTSVLDLACGHGRNTEFLRHHTKDLHLIDINASCIEACRERFGDERDGTRFHYHLTDGNHLRAIPDGRLTLVYSWDSMVHFDRSIVRDYVGEIARVLKPGGSAFLHHSNYGAKAPDSNWATNPGTRSNMSADLMRDFARDNRLTVTNQQIQGRAQGWGEDELDCVSILRKDG